MPTSPAQRVGRWVGVAVLYVFLPVAGLLLLLHVPGLLGGGLRATQGKGVHGTFTAQRASCGRRDCTWYGSFVSDDRTIHLQNAHVDEGITHVGDSMEALYEGDRDATVYRAHGSTDWALALALGAMGVAALTLSAFAYAGAWRRWRARR